MSETEDSADNTGQMGAWLATSTLRIALALLGFVLLLLALGQAVGINLLEMAIDALTSPTGRWIAVAFFALLLIVIAVQGFDTGARQ